MNSDPTKSSPGSSFVRVFMFTDLVGSTDLKRRLGDVLGAQAITGHDNLFRQCLAEFGGVEVDNAGDGFLSQFDRPSDAVRCALAFQQRLGSVSANPPLRVRIGMNMGEAVQVASTEGHGKYVGLAVDTAARVMSLGEGGQILLTRSAFDSARSQLLEAPDGSPLIWLAHGSYLCKGIDDPIEVCEVGLKDSGHLKPPRDSEKARRNVALDEEATLGWRPAPGQEIPHRKNWILESKLGDGGFGEVWLATQKHTRIRRVFKFCFQADRLKGLKREVALFRILKDSLGDRNDIAQILDWQFEEPPFFLEAEYTEGGSLLEWAEEKGGIANIPLEARIQIVIQVADALAAAHSVGVLHKDIKPGNILISNGPGGSPRARLTDFGIGLVTDPGALKGPGFTGISLPSTVGDRSSTGSGTQMYMAPELFEGKRATTLCDIYALGVMLYQLTVGDLRHALAMGWERNVKDELLREDIAVCVEGNPSMRLQSAKELADLLRNLESRHLRREQERKERTAARQALEYAESSRKRRMFAGFTILGLLVIVVAVVHFADAQRRLAQKNERLFQAAESARAAAHAAETLAEQRAREAEYGQYVANISLASSQSSTRMYDLAFKTLDESPPPLRNWEWGYLLRESLPDLNSKMSQAAVSSEMGSQLDFWSSANPSAGMIFKGHTDKVEYAAFSPDGTRIVSGSWDKTARVWDTATGARLMTLATHEGSLSGTCYTPDGRFILTSSWDKTARIYDAQTGAERRVLRGHTARLNSILGDPTSKTAITGSDDYTVIFWEMESGKEIRRLSGHKGAVTKMALSTDGKKLLTGSSDTTAKIWDTTTGRQLFSLEGGHSASVNSVAFSPDGKVAFTGSEDAKIVLWDAETGKRLDMMVGHSSTINDLAMSPDGTLVASASYDGKIRLWEPSTRRQVRIIDPGAGQLASIRFSSAGDKLLATFLDNTVRLIENATASRLDQLAGHTDLVLDAAFSSDSRRIATVSRDTTIRIWDAATASEIRTINAHTDYVRNVHFSHDGKRLLTTSWDKTAKVIDAETGAVLRSFEGHTDVVWFALFSPDEKRVLTGSWDRTARVWDVETGETLFTYSMDAEKKALVPITPKDQTVQISPVLPLNWSPDGARVIIASFANRPSVLDSHTGSEIFGIEKHTAFIVTTLFSPKGDQLLTASFDGSVRLWDAANGKETASVIGRQFVIPLSAAYNTDGSKFIFSTVSDGPQIYDSATGELVARLVGHAAPVWACSFSPDCTRAVSGADDGTVKVWDAKTGRELLGLPGLSGKIHKVIFSPDNRLILALSSDNTPHLWRILSWKDLSALGPAEAPLPELVDKWKNRDSAGAQ